MTSAPEIKTYDVVIVGSGPAGCSTALHLAALDPQLAGKTLVIEATHHPRQKICGGGITALSQHFLGEMGLNLDVPAVSVNSIVFRFRGTDFRVRRPNIFMVVRREEFDAALAAEVVKRGIEVREGTALESIEHMASEGETGPGSRLILHTSTGPISARAVVGADGAKSVVRRQMGLDSTSRVCRTIEILTPEDPEKAFEFRESTAIFDYSYVPNGVQGYVWDFPSMLNGEPRMNRGVCDFRVFVDRPLAPMKELFRGYLQHKGIELDRHKILGNPSRWYDPKAAIAAPGAILVGDAAGLEPLGGDGISAALWYGQVAARELEHAYRSGDWSFAGYTERVAADELGKYLRGKLRQARLVYGIRSTLVFKAFWRFARWYIERRYRAAAKAEARQNTGEGSHMPAG